MEKVIYFEDARLKHIGKRINALNERYNKLIDRAIISGDILCLVTQSFPRAVGSAQRHFLKRNMSESLKYVKIAESI